MDHKQELVNQVEVLKATQAKALENSDYDTVNGISSMILEYLTVLGRL